MKDKFYTLDKLKKTGADYRIVFGKRSNGKSYACLREIVQSFTRGEGEGGIIRRMEEDIRGKYASTLFAPLEENGEISKATAGEWDAVYYKQGAFYFSRQENGKTVTGPRFCRIFSISGAEHAKSSSYPEIRTILFDEFLTRDFYLPNEFVKFLNLLSTIIRGRSDVVVYMCGNTVSYDSPYFRGMGLDSVKSMRKGELREYVDEVTGRKIAVHYADATGGTTPSDKFFAFEDSKTRMITGGDWELEDWQKIKNKDRKTVLFRFFVQYQGEFLNCEIIADQKARNYIKVYNKPDPVRRWSDLCYTDQPDGSPYRPKMLTRTGVGDPMREVTTLIQSYFKRHQVYYTTNDAGEIMRNFIAWNKEEEEKAGY